MSSEDERVDDPNFLALLEYLRTERGFDFTGYKPTSLQRRMRKRMGLVGVEQFRDYHDYLEVHPDEFAQLFDALLINVTRFFRDEATWEAVRGEVIPAILQGLDADTEVRVWSAGCASGEEPYTAAMLLAEAMGLKAMTERVKIFATDVDEQALARARQATYTTRELEPVPQELRERYFRPADAEARRFTVLPELRRSVIFGRHDLVQDAPISRVSLLICRNTLMYLNAETQDRVLDRLHFALREDGFLVLGRAEMLLSHRRLFVPVDQRARIFGKVAGSDLRSQLLSIARDGDLALPPGSTEGELGLAAFQSNPVAEVVVGAAGVLHLANRRAMELFDLRPVDLGRPLEELELCYRPLELRSLVERVLEERRELEVGEVEWRDGSNRWFQVQVAPIHAGNGDLAGVSATFHDVTTARQLREELERAKRELDSAYDELQSTNEELETTNEELQSTVEEQETTNEELQSTNEELETMNEELQSTNVELEALNVELQQRTEELDQVNAYLESILASLRGSLAVVNDQYLVELWNEQAEDLWGMRPEEAKGRHLLDLDIGLPVAELLDPLRACLSGQSSELTVEATNRRGRPIRCTVRISPLRGEAGTMRGAILLMEPLPGEAAHA